MKRRDEESLAIDGGHCLCGDRLPEAWRVATLRVSVAPGQLRIVGTLATDYSWVINTANCWCGPG